MGKNHRNYVNHPKIVEHTYAENQWYTVEDAVDIIKNDYLTQQNAISLAQILKRTTRFSDIHPDDLNWIAIKSLQLVFNQDWSGVSFFLAECIDIDYEIDCINSERMYDCPCCGVHIDFDVAPSGRKYYIFYGYHD